MKEMLASIVEAKGKVKTKDGISSYHTRFYPTITKEEYPSLVEQYFSIGENFKVGNANIGKALRTQILKEETNKLASNLEKRLKEAEKALGEYMGETPQEEANTQEEK